MATTVAVLEAKLLANTSDFDKGMDKSELDDGVNFHGQRLVDRSRQAALDHLQSASGRGIVIRGHSDFLFQRRRLRRLAFPFL